MLTLSTEAQKPKNYKYLAISLKRIRIIFDSYELNIYMKKFIPQLVVVVEASSTHQTMHELVALGEDLLVS